MVKHTQTIHRQNLTNCLSVFDHFMGLPVKRLNVINPFHATDLFLYPLKTLENKIDFLVFSAGIDRNQRHDMD